MSTLYSFWMVQGPTGVPSKKHSTRAEAATEAARLAAKHPDCEFFVMQAVASYKTRPAPVVGFDLEAAPQAYEPEVTQAPKWAPPTPQLQNGGVAWCTTCNESERTCRHFNR